MRSSLHRSNMLSMHRFKKNPSRLSPSTYLPATPFPSRIPFTKLPTFMLYPSCEYHRFSFDFTNIFSHNSMNNAMLLSDVVEVEKELDSH